MRHFRSGQSLIEIMVVIVVMTVSLAASALIITNSIARVGEVTGTLQANLLAEEGVEAVISIRDNNWTNLTVGNHGLAMSGSPPRWTFSGSSDTTNGFVRTLAVSSLDSRTMLIIVTITWHPNSSRTASIEERIILTNWQPSV